MIRSHYGPPAFFPFIYFQRLEIGQSIGTCGQKKTLYLLHQYELTKQDPTFEKQKKNKNKNWKKAEEK